MKTANAWSARAWLSRNACVAVDGKSPTVLAGCPYRAEVRYAPGMPSTIPEASRLLLVGCGKMGGALLEGALASGENAFNVCVVEPAPPSPRLKDKPGLTWIA